MGRKHILTLFAATILAWVLFAVLAIINGVIRNSIYGPVVGELAGHQISTAIFCLVILAATFLFVRLVQPADGELIWIGLFWLSATIVFEFLFGHYVVGHPWSRLLADYNVLKGRVWSAVLAVTLFAPLIARKIFKA